MQDNGVSDKWQTFLEINNGVHKFKLQFLAAKLSN